MRTFNFIENSFFVVNVRENNYDNTGDANYSKSETFSNLRDAYSFYDKELKNIKTFETESQFKEVEFILNDDNDIFEVLDSETYNREYSKKEYGKYILHYKPSNNGASGFKVEKINSKTNFYVNDDKRFSVKSEIHNTQKEVINRIYKLMLYNSMEEAKEMFNWSYIK